MNGTSIWLSFAKSGEFLSGFYSTTKTFYPGCFRQEETGRVRCPACSSLPPPPGRATGRDELIRWWFPWRWLVG
jgi:hypothetical protein